MSQVEYTVILEPNQDEPGYTASVPALPGCISVGDTLEEALDSARDAIELWIRMARNRGEPVPQDFTVVSKITVGA